MIFSTRAIATVLDQVGPEFEPRDRTPTDCNDQIFFYRDSDGAQKYGTVSRLIFLSPRLER
jgi:hypothetical protein